MKTKRILITELLLTAGVALATFETQAVTTYNGSLNRNDGGIVAGDDWSGGDNITFSWTVTDTDAGLQANWWRYSYTWTGDDPGLSHLIIELSGNTTADDFVFPGGTELRTDNTNPSAWDLSPSNPGMPGPMAGVKQETGGLTTHTFTFDSSRVPVWGDFYAKGGQDSFAYNAGFLVADPVLPAANGSILNHILRPDTLTTTQVPEVGATVALLGIGALAMGLSRRRLKS